MYFINASSGQVSSVNLLQEEELRGAAVLIFANKQVGTFPFSCSSIVKLFSSSYFSQLALRKS